MTYTQVQLLLAYLGFYRGPIDGIWGSGSAKACEALQTQTGLAVDGIPGAQTQQALKKAVTEGLPGSEPDSDDAAFWSSIPNFEKVEFECRCGCGLNNVDRTLVRICQRLRDHFDAPFIISSPCRCQSNNRRAGGVANSQHLFGRAVDFCIRGKTAVQVLPIVQRQPEIRYAYAIDGHYVHMELPQGVRI